MAVLTSLNWFHQFVWSAASIISVVIQFPASDLLSFASSIIIIIIIYLLENDIKKKTGAIRTQQSRTARLTTVYSTNSCQKYIIMELIWSVKLKMFGKAGSMNVAIQCSASIDVQNLLSGFFERCLNFLMTVDSLDARFSCRSTSR